MAGFRTPCRQSSIERRGTLDTLIPEGHLARFIWTVVSGIDFSAMEAGYRWVPGGPGRPPYHPRILVALWVYGMTQGMETAAEIVRACSERDDFKWLRGGLDPSDQTLLNVLGKGEELTSIWIGVLQAMHLEGHVDLSVILEDGTKLRANASRRSFFAAEGVQKRIDELKALLEKKREKMSNATQLDRNDRAQVQAIQGQLTRAERAAQELRERADRASQPKRSSGAKPTASANGARVGRFRPSDFVHEEAKDVLICPADKTLRYIGRYATDNRRGFSKLYGRTDCTGCLIKEQCTTGRGRRVKILEEPEGKPEEAPSTEGPDAEQKKVAKSSPQASLTDPEAKLMLATSEKRWEPSFNADLAVTKDGVIVSQFLTKNPTDFHNFEPALENVLSALDRPEAWVGDGHYGTYDNLRIANTAQVLLYAPPAMKTKTKTKTKTQPLSPDDVDNDASAMKAGTRFVAADFPQDGEQDILICPNRQELRFIGEYSTHQGRSTYRLYGRSDCTDCPLKDQCTTGRGRRVKITTPASAEAASVKAGSRDDNPSHPFNLAQELAARMDDAGDEMQQIRRQTVEPTNAHLKQHGLGRFHVRGLDRCANALTLACLAHNLMKWNARRTAYAMKLSA